MIALSEHTHQVRVVYSSNTPRKANVVVSPYLDGAL